VVRSNVIGNMMNGPRELIRFHAEMMPLLPGDIISTGTPGAGRISPGDIAEARVGSIPALTNPVIGA
jgi:2-keto-4-pentenoate hydratase/2-oxohepta-3-ene-1,7-dioic acid hydratase in catechol pathway